jgi:hypothetical protein
MSMNRSVAELLTRLETQIAFHRERAAFHVEQEAFHRDKGGWHAAQLESLTGHLEAFRASAAVAAELAAAPAREKSEDPDAGARPKVTRLVERVLETLSPAEPFGQKRVTREVNQRFEGMLRRRVLPEQVSVVLRRMHRLGRIRSVRAGRPHWEALYVKERG